jgi:hypothetical protein
MKTIIAIIITAAAMLTASAQYRFTIYSASVATNASIASSNHSTINQSFDVASATNAIIQLHFKLANLTNATPATNSIVTVWDASLDGSRFTNQFTYTLFGNNTTNTETWDYTNSALTLPWLRLRYITNNTSGTLTNYGVKVGKRS